MHDLRERVPGDSDLVWILSSGTQSVNQIKCIGLSREAILVAAEGANRHLSADVDVDVDAGAQPPGFGHDPDPRSRSRDIWLNPLPLYHIGGFAILARGGFERGREFLFYAGKWDANAFHAQAERERATLTSLVPTQVHDLVRLSLRAPVSLRAIVVGGGTLDPGLYGRARDLGWPVLPSYGLTECGSQVATAGLESLRSSGYPALKVLSHVEVELRESRVCLRSAALCRWIATLDVTGEFRLSGGGDWFCTEDLAEWVSSSGGESGAGVGVVPGSDSGSGCGSASASGSGSGSGLGLKILGRRDDV
ncbi:MAG: AMP-binding protein, partial [Calothrix sp. SM1_5_4]|nr:AMP-binding protein [Calothrix sp. SM1_5_4]